MIPDDLILETDRVILRPLSANDFDAFLALSKPDPDMWLFFTFNLSDGAQLDKWIKLAYTDRKAGTRFPFTIIDKATGNIAGSSSLGNISFHDLRGEIGWTWLGSEYRSSGLNRHAKFSIMRYAFEELNFERIEFKTDVLNERSKKALRKIGAVEEGVFRNHMTHWNNRRRSSAYFSIIKSEWPALKETTFKDISNLCES